MHEEDKPILEWTSHAGHIDVPMQVDETSKPKEGENKQDIFVFPHAERSSGEPKQDENWLNTSFQDHQLTKAGNNLNQAHLKVQNS